jgi:hypothetical protein
MNVADMRVIQSPEARKMQADCHTLGHQGGLELEKVYWWLVTDRQSPAPYELTIKIRGLSQRQALAFSRDDILGYRTGQSTAAVLGRMREALQHVRSDVEEPPVTF